MKINVWSYEAQLTNMELQTLGIQIFLNLQFVYIPKIANSMLFINLPKGNLDVNNDIGV